MANPQVMELVYLWFFLLAAPSERETETKVIMGSRGSHWRPARKRRPYLKQLIKKTPIVGQLFKANSKIALEPEVLEVFLCVLFLFCFKNFAKVIGSTGADLASKWRLLRAEELSAKRSIARRWLWGGCWRCNFLFLKKGVGMFLNRGNTLKLA